MAKAKPGVCGVCGCAVVRSINEPPQTGWLNGHRYLDGRLVQTRCRAHEGQGWPAEEDPNHSPMPIVWSV